MSPTGLGKNETAADEFEKTIAFRGVLEDVFLYEAYLGLGQAPLGIGHHKKAREGFREAVALDPEGAAEEYEALKDQDKDAAAELKEAIDAAAK